MIMITMRPNILTADTVTPSAKDKYNIAPKILFFYKNTSSYLIHISFSLFIQNFLKIVEINLFAANFNYFMLNGHQSIIVLLLNCAVHK